MRFFSHSLMMIYHAHTDGKKSFRLFNGVRSVRTVSVAIKTPYFRGFLPSPNTLGLCLATVSRCEKCENLPETG